MGWEDLLRAGEKGRWWRTGARWAGAEPAAAPYSAEGRQLPQGGRTAGGKGFGGEVANSAEARELETAAKLCRMNTDARRAAFGAIMGADGVDDAMMRLGEAGCGRSFCAGHGHHAAV